MPEFIRYSEDARDADGLNQLVHYVSLDAIQHATYSPKHDTLVLRFICDGKDAHVVTLRGPEAEAARAIIDKLHA